MPGCKRDKLLVHESLIIQDLKQDPGKIHIVSLFIPHIGKDLGKGCFVVFPDKPGGIFPGFLCGIIIPYLLVSIIGIDLPVYYCICREPVGLFRMFCRPS